MQIKLLSVAESFSLMALSRPLKKWGGGGGERCRRWFVTRVNDNQVVATTMNKQDKFVEWKEFADFLQIYCRFEN